MPRSNGKEAAVKKQVPKLAFRKETLTRLQGAQGGTGTVTFVGTTSLVITATMGGGGGRTYNDTVYRTEPVEINDTVVHY